MIDNATAAIDQWDIADKTLAVLPCIGNLHLLQQSAGLSSKMCVQYGLNEYCKSKDTPFVIICESILHSPVLQCTTSQQLREYRQLNFMF